MLLKQPLLLKPSYGLVLFLILIHLGAVIVVINVALPWFIVLSISVLVFISLLNSLRRYALQISPKAIIKIELKNNGEWLLQTRQGRMLSAKLSGNSFRSLYLVVLNFKLITEKSKITVIILPDSLPADYFRRLRAQLFVFPSQERGIF